MPQEYDDPITNDVVEDAVRLAASLRVRRPSASVAALATEAVDFMLRNFSCQRSARLDLALIRVGRVTLPHSRICPECIDGCHQAGRGQAVDRTRHRRHRSGMPI